MRHHLFYEILGLLVDIGTVDEDFTDIRAQVVTDGSYDHVAFLVYQERGFALFCRLFDGIPELQQVIQVPLQFLFIFPNAGSAHDHSHSIRYHQVAHGFTKFSPLFSFDASRYPTCTGIVRHKYQVSACKRDEGGECGAFVATLFLFHLDDDFLTFFQGLLDAGSLIGFQCFFAEITACDFL